MPPPAALGCEPKPRRPWKSGLRQPAGISRPEPCGSCWNGPTFTGKKRGQFLPLESDTLANLISDTLPPYFHFLEDDIRGFLFSMFSGLGDENWLFRPFIFIKFPGLGALSLTDMMSEFHWYKLSPFGGLSLSHSVPKGSVHPAHLIFHSYYSSLNFWVCQEKNFTPHPSITCRQVPRAEVPDMPDRIVAATAVYLEVPAISRDGHIWSSRVQTVW